MARATKKELDAKKLAMVPSVGSDMERVLKIKVVRRQTLDDAHDALCEAIETDQAQVVAKHLQARQRIEASTEAMTAKVREGQVLA